MRACRFGLAVLFAAGLVLGAMGAGPARGQSDEELKALGSQIAALYKAGKYAEAVPLAERYALAMKARHGADHPQYAVAISDVAQLLRATNRLAQAEPLLRRALAIYEKSLGPEHPNVTSSLNDLAQLLQATNQLAQAEPLLRRALAIDEKSFGRQHRNVATRLNNLAHLLQATNRLAEAEPLMRRALGIYESSGGPEHPDVAVALTNLGQLLKETNRFIEAEPLHRRALAIFVKNHGPEHPWVAMVLSNLGLALQEANRSSEAESSYRRAITIHEKHSGPGHIAVATPLNNLATLLLADNRLSEAEPLQRRVITIFEKSLGAEHPNLASALTNLAQLLKTTNRLAEAEPLMRRALDINERSLGPEHFRVATALGNLAGLLFETNRFAEAEPLMRRALAIDEKSFGPAHFTVATALNNLAQLLKSTNRIAEAEPMLRRALAIAEQTFGAEHPNVAAAINNLARLLEETNRHTEVEPLFRRALAIDEKSLGPGHPSVARDLNNLAGLLLRTRQFTEAEPLYRRALAIDEKSFGPEHPDVAMRLNNLANLRAELGDWGDAAGLHRRAKPVMTAARSQEQSGDRSGLARAVLSARTRDLRAAARAVHRANGSSAEAREEGFELAQWALQTAAADALVQMSVRFAKGAGPLAQGVRERQDLIARRQSEDRRLLAAVGKADAKAADAARTAMAGLDTRLDAIDRRLANEFPEYTSLAGPSPLAIAAIQALLKPDEALVVFLDIPGMGWLPEETLAWGLTRTEARWLSIPLGTQALTSRIAALRCGLDGALWKSGEAQDRCVEIVKAHPPQVNVDGQVVDVLPFDLERAHELYKVLLGPMEDLIKGKHLLVVPSGPLTSLPFNVLVTEAPKAQSSSGATPTPGPSPQGGGGSARRTGASLADYKQAAWLGTRQPITVLPSVASLKSLRQFARTSHAGKAYLGVGNPLLDGEQGHPQWGAHYKKQAEAARDNQQCTKKPAMQIASARGRRSTIGFAKLFRGGQADIEEVRSWSPLPETADELCEVGRRLGVPESEILLGSRATEAALKELSENGRLAEYRILHFATHGALTGQVGGLAEPGLVLTPPAKGTNAPPALERDDGFLTASEIATLKLNADWVILSACNTAGASGESAEALSGMARAFFYAGVRALLVSHWGVGSEAAVKLTTRAFAELKSDPGIGRADAFRRSMRELIDKGSAFEAHPSQWGPFVVVGEGAQ